MARGDLLCPIDGLTMNLPAFTRDAGNEAGEGEAVGEHVHFTVTANVVCSNGHRWVIDSGEIQFRRIV